MSHLFLKKLNANQRQNDERIESEYRGWVYYVKGNNHDKDIQCYGYMKYEQGICFVQARYAILVHIGKNFRFYALV